MPVLIPIDYRKRKYPGGIEPAVFEIAGHLDKESIDPPGAYSLHTEYSYAKRKLCSKILDDLHLLKAADSNGVPCLWQSADWAYQFFVFIKVLTKGHPPPTIIEIHPPFDDYCPSISSFLSYYEIFERNIRAWFPRTDIIIENRFGSRYRGANFIVSRSDQIIRLAEETRKNGLDLKIALDFPQFLSAYGGAAKLSSREVANIISSLAPEKSCIKSIHLWGKKKNKRGMTVSHAGNLDTLFENDKEKKEAFLSALHSLFDDDVPRYFVPEVNGLLQYLSDIVNDLQGYGFRFIQPDSC